MGRDVVYACDNKYAMLAGVSMESLYTANRELEDLNVYILANQLSEENRRKLSEIAERHGRDLRFVDFTGEELERKLSIDAQFWSIAAYARLFAPQLLFWLHDILYLDCDMLILGPLTELWNTDTVGMPCAAVAEPMSGQQKKNVGLAPTDKYYNSGVMLMDLDAWRDAGALEKSLDCIRRHKGRVPYVDQGVINEVFRGQFLTLPAKYNVSTLCYDFSYEEAQRFRADSWSYSRREIEAAKTAPVIVHLTSSFLTPRPWVQSSTHPYRTQWESFRDRTAWNGAEKWPDRPGASKFALRWIFRHTPRPVGIAIARLINSELRPLLKR